MENQVRLEDQSLRDGLQAETITLSLEEKLELFELLIAAGVQRIQVGSFVHPKIVPQLADTDRFISQIGSRENILLTGLVLNGKGLERAQACGLKHISLSSSVSNSHSLKNVKKNRQQALEEIVGLIGLALDSGIAVRAGVQCAFGCVEDGQIEESFLFEAIGRMYQAGALECNLADTSGMANPWQIKKVVRKAKELFPQVDFSLHLHDTRGFGIANMVAGYQAGIRLFDTSTGGLGGCPFVEGAAGNIATEDAVHLFDQIGEHTNIDLQKLCKVNQLYEKLLDRRLPGRICRLLWSSGCTPPQ